MTAARLLILSVLVGVGTVVALPHSADGSADLAPASSPPASVEVLAAQPGE